MPKGEQGGRAADPAGGTGSAQRTIWIAGFLTFAVALAGAWGLAALRDRAATLDQAVVRLEATTRVLEQHAERAFESGDRVLRALVEIAGPHDLADAEAARAPFDQLRRIIADSPQISSAWVLDAEGVTRLENWAHPPRSQGSFAQRDYVRALQERPGQEPFIGSLQTGGISGRPRFTMARALPGPDGTFAGTVVAGVYSEYFAEVYGDAALGARARFTLAKPDGTLLAAWPPEALPAQGEGTELRAMRDLRRYPVRITVTQPVAAALEQWRTRTVVSGLGVVAVALSFGGLTLLGLRGAEREASVRAQLTLANAALERRVAERTSALESSQAELQSLYDTAPVGLCMVTADLRYVRVNRRLAEMNGAPAEAHIGRTAAEIVPDLAPPIQALSRLVIASGEPALNVEIAGETPARPGERRYWNQNWLPLKDTDGRVVGINIVADEITERRRAEMALRAANERVTELLEGMSEGFLLLDHAFRVVMVNRHAERMEGRPRCELLGRTHWELWPASVGTAVEAAYRRVMAERVPVSLECRYVSERHDNWVDIRAFPTEEGIGILFRDITDRKLAEDNIRRLLERTRQLSEYNEVAVREMGHRIMNSLQTLEGLLAMQARASAEPAARAVMELATQRVRAMAVVQQRLFHATRDDALTIDLGAYLRGLGEDLARSFLSGERCTLAVEAEPGIRVSASNASAAAMVVAELVINACKYAFADGDCGRVLVRLAPRGQGYRIEVRDDGRGLPAGFDPKSSKGLGMRIMQAMTRQLGGTFEIHAASPGTGCVLTVPVNRAMVEREVEAV